MISPNFFANLVKKLYIFSYNKNSSGYYISKSLSFASEIYHRPIDQDDSPIYDTLMWVVKCWPCASIFVYIFMLSGYL